jgi:hypothetical protein
VSEPVLLFIVTDDPDVASLAVIGLHRSELPAFVRIVTDADEIRRVPDGVRCVGYWSEWGSRKHDAAQLAWSDRKDAGGLEGLTVAFMTRLDEWLAKRAAAEAKLIAEALADAGDAPVTSFSEFANAQAAARAVETEKVSVLPKQSRWK